jgi:ABC-type phosphate transport system substrate-binding protein
VTWTAAGGWRASVPERRPGPTRLRLAPAPKGVITQARARQHRRRQRIVLTSAPVVGAGAGLAARDSGRWFQTGHGSHGHRGAHGKHWPALAAGAGSFTTQNLFGQFNADFNQSRSSTLPSLHAWDATTSPAGPGGGSIVEKPGCAPIPRPNGPGDGGGGPGAGIGEVASFARSTSGQYCTDFATSPRPRLATDPPYERGGVAFVTLAGDAVTWSTQTVTDAPTSLTTSQLHAIYTCADTNWAQVGGKDATIRPFLPQVDSGTSTSWLRAIGVITPGACVDTVSNSLEENEGVDPALNHPEVIFPYSVGDYIDQRYRSAPCLALACASNGGPVCIPPAGMNQFGCDVRGTMVLGEINGVSPTTGGGAHTAINRLFPSSFVADLYVVVPYDPHTFDHIPGPEPGAPGGVNLESIFGASGWACTSATARHNIQAYGFVPLPACGSTS